MMPVEHIASTHVHVHVGRPGNDSPACLYMSLHGMRKKQDVKA